MDRAIVSSGFPPMTEMNTTPLIDVMLVLLIMFIITIPIQTHAVKIDTSPSSPVATINPISNTLVITADSRIEWNGRPIMFGQLEPILLASQRRARTPELHLRPDADAPYQLVDRVLAVTKRANVERMGFIGNEAYRTAF